jgi:hypothetical protein
MAKIESFTANLSREGSTGSVRGKIPATLISAMGGDDGDVIEFQINGKTLVGGRIISGKEARAIRSEGRHNFGQVPSVAAKAPAKAKAVPKKVAVAKPSGRVVAKPTLQKAVKKAAPARAVPAAKGSKNRTSVTITKPPVKGQGGKVKPRFSI